MVRFVGRTSPIGTAKLAAKRRQNFGKFREGSVFQEGRLTKEGKVKFKADGKTVIEERKPDFTPIDQFLAENLPKAQGAELELLEKVKERRDKRQAIIDREEAQFLIDVANPRPDRTVLGRIAQVGLLPATFIGNTTTAILEGITGKEFGRTKAGELAETPAGKALGLGTVAAAVGAIGAGIAAKTTATATAAQIGKAGISPSIRAKLVTKYASNIKSKGLTTRLMAKIGLSLGAAGLLVTAIGNYPFAGFIKQEASQTTGIGFFQANNADDVAGMAEAIERQEEIVNAEKTILDWIPFANVSKQLREFFESVRVKLASDKRIFAQKAIELEGGG